MSSTMTTASSASLPSISSCKRKRSISPAMMLRVTVCSLLLVSVSGSTYVAPGQCSWSHGSTTSPSSTSSSPSSSSISKDFEVTLVCHVGILGHEAGLNLSMIQPDHTTSLNILCADPVQESRLQDGGLRHLHHLKSLSLIGCRIQSLSESSLTGVTLTNLTVRRSDTLFDDYLSLNQHHGHHHHLTPPGLTVSPVTLHSQRHTLQHLDLGFNQMTALDNDLFCPLTHLKVLNLTRNRLTGFTSLGLVDHMTGSLCLQQLEQLDLSHNKIRSLSETDVASLKNLRSLLLHHNQISQVAELSLSALSKLQTIDLSHNQMPSLPSRLLRDSLELKHLYLNNNTLSSLPPHVFKGLSKMVLLNLGHNNIPSDQLNRETFLDLIRLLILDLSHNRIHTLNGTLFESQYSLQLLHMNDNDLQVIGDNTFSSLYNLDTLILTSNQLKTITPHTLNGLFVLRKLYLNQNELTTLSESSFTNCSSIVELSLDGNLLSSVPKGVMHLKKLKHFGLKDNRIITVKDSFPGMGHLESLDLGMNQIVNLSRGSLSNLSNLKELSLASNVIKSLDHGVFDDAPALKSIHLQGNLLTDINGLFMNLPNLRLLNVSRNSIGWFDYALVPKDLTHFDIRGNRLEELGNYFDLSQLLSLKWMDVSNNLLQKLTPTSLPHKIEYLNVALNRLSDIQSFTFKNKPHLRFVDLRNNSLSKLDINSLQLDSNLLNKLHVPEFLVSNNPFICDCNLEWMQSVNSELGLSARYPKVPDLKQVTCALTFGRGMGLSTPIMSVNSTQFLCKYKTHCFALCHCCDFDACDCEMMCPEGCNCFYDQTWNTNIVDCSSQKMKDIPTRIPMDVTELYIDNNDITTLTSHAFIGRKNMKVLYLNGSRVNSIANRTFNGLTLLQVIHLEHNQLAQLNGFEFDSLSGLKELYLDHNKIFAINNRTFSNLRSLEVLTLNHNVLSTYRVWELNSNRNLRSVLLSGNPWSCGCQFMQDLQDWVQVVGSFVKDSDAIQCRVNETAIGPFLWSFNLNTCVNSSLPVSASSSSSNVILPSSTIGSRSPPLKRGWIPSTVQPPADASSSGSSSSSSSSSSSLSPSKEGPFPTTSDQENNTNSFLEDSIVKEYLPLVVAIVTALFFILMMVIVGCVYKKELKVWVYSKYGVRFLNGSRFAPEPDRLFDGFVSYCKKDEAFIAQILAPELECGHPPYRLCLRYRDLPVTGYVTEAITEAIESSHRTIILMSEQYLKSESCRFELKVAHHESQVNRSHKVIVVLLDQNSLSDLDADARIILRSCPFVHWEDKHFWEKLRYEMPAGRGQKPMNCPDIRASLEFKRALTLGSSQHHLSLNHHHHPHGVNSANTTTLHQHQLQPTTLNGMNHFGTTSSTTSHVYAHAV